MKHKITALDNGFRVITTYRPGGMTTAIRIYVRAGSRYDNEHPGKAHFVEHLLFNGTNNRSSRQIYEDIESLGGMIQANTTKEYTNFSTVVMDRYLENGLDVIADVISNPIFALIPFFKEKLVIIEEIKRAQDTQNILWDIFSEVLWPENPIGRPTLGHMESLRDMEYGDVVDFYRQRYTASNMVISICGSTDHDYAMNLVEQKLSYLQAGEEFCPELPISPPLPKRAAHLEKDIHQTHIVMGVLGADMKSEDRYAVKLMDRILGSGGSSRLSQKLREEEKLVYSVYSVAPMYEDTGCFAVCTECSPENASLVEEVILSEWDKLRSDPVSDAELEAARRIYEGTLAREYESNMYVAGISGIEALLHKIEPFAESVEKISAITKQDILNAANCYLDAENYAIATVGRKQRE